LHRANAVIGSMAAPQSQVALGDRPAL